MPRPKKGKKVCCMPENNLFGSLNDTVHQQEIIIMSVEEYETIRLIDLQRFTQEECAQQMDIARTTVQRIYNEARIKLAESLINAKQLRIEGGNYKLCEGLEKSCGCGGCKRHRYNATNQPN